MTSTVLILISVISLFFSLIFSTQSIQHKAWQPLFISLSLCLLSLTSFHLFIGQYFAWYDWTVRLFIIGYLFIMPSLLGLVAIQVGRVFQPALTLRIALGYSALLLVGAAIISYTIWTADAALLPTTLEQVLLWNWVSEHFPWYSAIISVSSILVILFCLWLWIRKLGSSYLFLCISGLISYLHIWLLSQREVSLLWFGGGLILLLYFITQGGMRGMQQQRQTSTTGGKNRWNEV